MHNMPQEEVKINEQESFQMAEQCEKAASRKWNNLGLSTLGPKFHSLAHFAHQFRSTCGSGPFHEQFVEMDHRDGNVELRRN